MKNEHLDTIDSGRNINVRAISYTLKAMMHTYTGKKRRRVQRNGHGISICFLGTPYIIKNILNLVLISKEFSSYMDKPKRTGIME